MSDKKLSSTAVLVWVAVLLILCGSATVIYNLPAVHDRLAWRIEGLWSDIKYAIHPPAQQVFVPSTPVDTVTPAPIETLPPTPTIVLITPTTPPTSTPIQPPTLTPTPLPVQAKLKGIQHEYQTWNNCGPANLAMALSFWGWKGDQHDTASILKPNKRDKNVMPYEMEAYVDEQTELAAVVRVGGELTMLKAFISAGFPVITEKGFEGPTFDGWMGHYQVVNGYDDGRQQFIVQDSYKGPDFSIPYADFQSQWRAFNYTYIVIYPPDRQPQVLELLGLQAYDNFNYHYAEQKATADIAASTGRDLYFALFNRGANLVYLQDYAAASTAFDAAFANYPSIPEAERPWRMLWYNTTPYFAYYFTVRYQDVINLATITIEAVSEPTLEESYYWRARAELALGDKDAAIKDLRQCLEIHEAFQPCVQELANLGLKP